METKYISKRLKSIAVLIIILFNGQISSALTYYSGASLDPTVNTSWWTNTNGTGSHPAAFAATTLSINGQTNQTYYSTLSGDTYIIQSGHTMLATQYWNVTGTLHVNSGGVLSLNTPSTRFQFAIFQVDGGGTAIINRQLTVTGTTTISGSISFGSTSSTVRQIVFTGAVTLNSGSSWTVPATYTNGTANANTYTFSAGFTIYSGTTFSDAGVGTYTFTATPTLISPISLSSVALNANYTNSGTLTVRGILSGTGTLTNDLNAILNLGGNATISGLTVTATGNLVNYNGTATQTLKGTTYYNLTLSNSGGKTLSASTTVNNILSVEMSSASTITGTSPTYASSATLQYNTSTARPVGLEWTPTLTGPTTNGVVIGNIGAITLNAAKVLDCGVPLTINSGATLITGNFGLTFGGNFTNNGTFTAGSSPIVLGSATCTGTQSISGFTTTGLVSMTKTGGTATFTGNVNGAGLTINGSGGTINLGTSLTHTFTGNITLTAGTLNGGSSILNVNSSSATAWNGTGSVFTAGTGTVVFGGVAQTIATTTTFNNLTFAGTGSKTLGSGTVTTVNGVLSIENGTSANTFTGTLTYGSATTLQYNAGSSARTVAAEWPSTFSGTGGVIIKGTGTITIPVTTPKTLGCGAPLNINSGAALATNNNTITLGGDFSNSGTFTTGSSPIVIGTCTNTQNIGGFTTTGTVSMTKTGGTATLTGNVTGAGLTINGTGGTLNLGTSLTHTFSGNITLTAGSLNGGSSALNVNSVSVTAWNGTGSVFTAGTGIVNFGGAGAQTIAANSSFWNLSFSGSGTKTLSNSTTIGNNFSLSSGVVANLGTITTHTAKSLSLAGTIQGGGSWGSTSSIATNQNNTYFSATSGIITINCTAPNAPASGGNETICANQSITALTVTVGSGQTADWYDNSGSSLATGTTSYTPTVAGTYFAEAKVISGSCVSTTRTAVVLTINPLPAALTLTGSSTCPNGTGTITSSTSATGVNYQLYNSGNTTVGSAVAGTGAPLTWSGIGIANGYYAISTNGSTNCSSAASSSVNITAYSVPTAMVLSGNSVCASPGNDGQISSTTSVIGINYQLYNGSNVAQQTAISGTGSSLTWTGISVGSGYYAIGTSTSTGCFSAQSNTATVSSIPNTVSLVLTGSVICASPGNNGIITSSTSQTGSSYQLYDNSNTEVGFPVAGTGSGLSWTSLNVLTGYYVVGTNASLCASASSNLVDVASRPVPSITLTSSAGSNVCFSTSASSTTLAYTGTTNNPDNYSVTWNAAANTAGLINVIAASLSGSPISIPVAASVAPGTYSATLFVGVGSCYNAGTAISFTVNALPSPLVLTGSTICTSPGNNGTITSSTSVNGINYQLYNSSNATVGTALAGTGSGLTWTSLAAGTGYYVIGTNGTTTCVSSTSNAVNVSTNANPTALVLTGSTICSIPGSNGTITSGTSVSGVSYQLYNSVGSAVGSAQSGTGSALSWTGLAAGNGYYAIGTNIATYCPSPNSNAVNVSANANPTLKTIAASSSTVCAGSGTNITVAGSLATETYQLRNNADNSSVGSAVTGNGSTLNLPTGNLSVTTTFNVLATTTSTGCTTQMVATPAVTVNAVPAISNFTASAAGVCGAGGSVVTVNSTTLATGNYTVTYNVSGTNTISSTTASMSFTAGSPGNGTFTTANLPTVGAANVVNITSVAVTSTSCSNSVSYSTSAFSTGASGVWTGTTSNNWFTTTNWCNGAIPIASTNVTITGGLTNYPSIGTTGAVCNNISISSGASLTITGSNALAVSGNWTNNGTFTANTSTVTFNGTSPTFSGGVTTFNNLTLSTSGVNTFTTIPTVNGILTMTGTATVSAAPTYGSSATLQYSTTTTRTAGPEWITTFAATGGVILAGTGAITLNGAKVFNTSVPLTINSGSTLNTSSSNYSMSMGGNFSNSGVLTANASPILISGAMTTQTLSGFTTTGSVSMTKTTGTATMQGSINAAGLTINGSGGTLNLGAGLNHTFTGDVTLSAGTLNGGSSTLNDNSASVTAWNGTGSLFTSGTGTVIFGAPGNQTLSASATTFNNLTFAITGTITFTSTTTISGAFTIASSVVANLGTGLSHTAGSLSLGGYGQSSGSWGGATSSATYLNTTYFASATGIVTVGTSSCLAGTCVWLGGTSTDWGTASNWCGGIPTNSSTVVIPSGGYQPVISTGGGSAAYCNYLTINSGATLTITGTNTLTITTNITNNGSFVPGSGSTVVLTGGNQTISGNAMTFNNLSLISLGVKTFSNAPTVNGFLYIQGTATISIAPIYGSNATLQYQTTTARTAGVEWITPFTGTGGVVIASSGTITLNSAKVFGTSVPLYINPSSSLATNDFEVDFGGSFTNSGTFTAGGSPIVITGTMGTQSIAGFTTTGSVSMTKTAGTVTLTGSMNGAGLIINGTGGTLNLGTGFTDTFTGNFALTAGTLIAGSSTLVIGGNGTGGGTFTAGTSTVNYNASATQTVAPFTYNNLTLSGSSAKTTTGITVNGILSREGTATVSAVPTYGAAATLQYKGSSGQTTGPEFPATWIGTGGLKIENANGVTLGSAGNLGSNPLNIGDIVSNSVFSDGGFGLTATGTINLTSGTFTVNYSSFPAFTTTNIGTGTTVNYSAAATQTVKGITYSNLTISGAGTNSKIADGNMTVNGILNLSSANASSTQGCLDMNTTPFILSMGATATITGTGDVTGIVKRTNFVVNTPYSFGNQFTTLNMQAGGTLPTSVSVKITLSSSPLSWLTNGIRRVYNFIQTGGSVLTLTTMDLHYLSSEIYGTSTEGSLDIFDNDEGGSEDHGVSNFNTTNKWVGLANIPITYIALSSTDFSANSWSLGETTLSGVTWVGTTSTDWTDGSNWSGGSAPISTSNVIIPAVVSPKYQPTLPASTTINTLAIQSGGILNGGTGTSLTIAGSTGAWNNKGTFNAGTSTVIFTNSTATMSDPTNFNNVTVANGATLILGSNNIMRIGGILSLSSSGVLNAASNPNTIEYNGTSQTVVNPNGSTTGYSNLILSGSGTKTMPSSALTIAGDFSMSGSATATTSNTLTIAGGFTLSGTASAAAGAAISVGGNVTLGSGTTFAPSSYSHAISGNWTNNGATFAPTAGTITFNSTLALQAINGTAVSQTFYNLTIAKTSQTLTAGGSTTSLTLNNFIETSGNFTSPATLTINGATTLTSGIFIPGTTTTNLLGNLTNNGATFTDASGTVNFNGSLAQTIGGSASNTFNNVTVNNTLGVTASINQTINGVLNLLSANASSTKGSLDMGTSTLFMGASATTTGTSDVTGIVNRTSFAAGTPYTFGNQYTTLNMAAGGTLPGSVSFKIVLSNSWKTSGIINRYYDIIQTGGDAATFATLNLHYLSGELNGATEGNLDLFDHDVSPAGTEDQGSSNYNTTNKWVGLANLGLMYIAPSAFDVKYWTIGTSTIGSGCTWSAGASSTNWNDAGNWTGGVPVAASNVIIPSGKSYYPVLPASTTINSMNIQAGGAVTGGTSTVLTIAGGTGAWFNTGTFTPGTSTVVFTNAGATMADPTNFYNVTVANGASLTLGTDNMMRIAGTLSLSSTGVLNAATNHNTVEYNGTNQTVIMPNGSTSGYHNLILSGSGTKTMPSAAMNLYGDFTLSGSASATALNDITIKGNWSDASSGSFTPGSNTVIFNGANAQTISGVNTFNNLTIFKTAAGEGVSASANQTVNGILYLNSPNNSATMGALDLGSYTLSMGQYATTTGTGDITGTVSRNTLAASTTYTFGNQYSSIAFASTGNRPTSLSVTISLGTAPTWKTNAIQRVYTMAETGAVSGGAKATILIHYLDTELNSNTESLLVPWTSYSGSAAAEGARSDFDLTNDFITISNVDFFSFPSGTMFTLANTATSSYTWTGMTSINWNDPTNWSSAVVPGPANNVIIPDGATTNYDPTLPETAEISTINIQNGGVLNGAAGAVLTLDGSSGTWNCDGTFNPSTSTVIFANASATVSGTTNFYNLTINSGTSLAAESGAVIGIASTVSNGGTWSLVSQGPTTVNYNGGSQSVVIPNASTLRYSTLILSGTGTKTMPASALNINGDFILGGSATATAGGVLTILGQAILGSGTTFTAGSYTHSLSGNWTNTGGTLSGGTGTINFNGTASQTIGGTSSTTFNTLDINNTAGVLLGIATNATNLTIGDITSGSLFYDNGYQLTGPGYGSGTVNLHSGTFKLGSSTATTFPDTQTRTIAEGTTVEYAATTTQTIEAFTYSNLTISGAGNNSKTAEGNITVNGILNLNSTNASATQGCLDMGSYTLTMGGSSTTTGTGDVTGIVTRTSFVMSTIYSFGNQFSTMAFTVGPLPSSVSFNIILTGSGGVPWKTDGVNRYYDIISSYASGDVPTESNTRLAMNLHYLASELNGNMPANLDLFDVYLLQNNRVDDAGRSYSNTTDGWVGFSNVGLYFLSGSAWNQRNWTMGTALYGTNISWLGGSPSGHTDWQLPGNWEGGVPISTSDVTIPGGLSYYPVLPNISQTINSIQIQSGAVVNSTGTPALTIAGGTGAWQNEGTFNPGSSTVIFTNPAATLTGSTNFNNLTVATGASLDLSTGNTIGISGVITLSGSGKLNASGSGTTIDYNGTGQSVIIPNGTTPGYYNLTLDGSGSVTMPGSTLSILGNLTVSGSASVTPTAIVTVSGSTTVSGTGNLILGASNLLSNSGAIVLDGGTFTTGATIGYSETVGTLDLTNNSAINLGTGSHTLTFAASNGVSWTSGQILTISGWIGTYNGTSGTAGKIFVGSSNTGLTTMQLAQTRFYDGTHYYSAIILSTGEVVPNGISNNWTWTGINNNEWDDGTNWFSFNGGVPPSGADVIIATGTYQPQVDEAITCHNLTINSGSVLTITGSGALTVTNTITNSAGSAGLVIEATSDAAGTTGSLLNDNSAVSATVQRWMTGDLWHLISPAATGGQTVSDFVGTTPNANLIARNTTNYGLSPYTESNDSWNYYLVSGSNTSGTFGVPGKGFQVLRATGAGTGQGNDPADNGVVSFVGTLAAGNQTIGIAQTGNGWNLIGNPYPCALDVIGFLTTNSTYINPSYLAIYVSDIGDISTYGYTAINNSSSFELSSGEGFFVKSASGGMHSVSFTTAMKSAASNAFKSAPMLYPAVTLSASSGTDKMSTSVKYISGMTTGLDPGWDAGLFNNGPVPFSLFTHLVQDNGVDFAIQCLPDTGYEKLAVPVGLVAMGGSTVTFKAVADNLPSNLKVYLEDRKTGIFTRLDDGSVYSVTLGSASQGAGRFYLHTAESIAVTPVAPKTDLKVIPMPQSQIIRVLGAINLPARASIYDMTGRIITEMTLTGQDLNDIPLVNASTGLYLLKIESDKALVSEKIRWIKN